MGKHSSVMAPANSTTASSAGRRQRPIRRVAAAAVAAKAAAASATSSPPRLRRRPPPLLYSRRRSPVNLSVSTTTAATGTTTAASSVSVASSLTSSVRDSDESNSGDANSPTPPPPLLLAVAPAEVSSSTPMPAAVSRRRQRRQAATPTPPPPLLRSSRVCYNLRSRKGSSTAASRADNVEEVEEASAVGGDPPDSSDREGDLSAESCPRRRPQRRPKHQQPQRQRRTPSDNASQDRVATSALLRAAIVALSPLRPAALVAALPATAAADSSQQTGGSSSQQEMQRKLKRVAKRRIEVDASVAAALANRQYGQFSSASSSATSSQAEDGAVGSAVSAAAAAAGDPRFKPTESFTGACAAGASSALHDEDELLLDQSLEQSYWQLYQDCEYRDCVLRLCRQTDCVRWEDVLQPEMLDSLRKVGEGVYGEVYAARRGRQEVALKIFPIEGGQLVNGEPQKMFHEVLPELLISRKLTNLAYRYRGNKTCNFVQLLSAAIVRGKFPTRLSEEWEAFSSGVRASDNENPEFLPARQQWLLLEYRFAGCPLPAFRFGCYREARSVILQLALSLAAAEAQFQFEHRDLHWNNVLVRHTDRAKIRYRVADHNYAVNCHGLEVAIIDFTVSRVSPAPGYVLYIDMSGDEGIFVGDGDYQFEVYRMMRRECGDDWRRFNPRSNLMWLHYLLDKLLTATVFPRRDPDCLAVQSELTALQDCLLNYASCEQLVRDNFYFLENALDNDAAGLE